MPFDTTGLDARRVKHIQALREASQRIREEAKVVTVLSLSEHLGWKPEKIRYHLRKNNGLSQELGIISIFELRVDSVLKELKREGVVIDYCNIASRLGKHKNALRYRVRTNSHIRKKVKDAIECDALALLRRSLDIHGFLFLLQINHFRGDLAKARAALSLRSRMSTRLTKSLEKLDLVCGNKESELVHLTQRGLDLISVVHNISYTTQSENKPAE